MNNYCETCGKTVSWIFVGKRKDEHGLVFEGYRCPECGTEKWYAVG